MNQRVCDIMHTIGSSMGEKFEIIFFDVNREGASLVTSLRQSLMDTDILRLTSLSEEQYKYLETLSIV